MKRLRIVKTGIELGIRVTRKQRPRDIGVWIRKEIEDLGVFSQKMGQWISNRDDLFGKEFTAELKSLQNDIRPMSSTDFSDMTRDISALITIDEKPLATGTVGQVHKGVIKTTGDIVAIKIKKPGVTECLEEDARFVMTIASFFASIGIEEAKRVEDITRSFMNDIVLETDFEAETKHMTMFASEVGEDGLGAQSRSHLRVSCSEWGREDPQKTLAPRRTRARTVRTRHRPSDRSYRRKIARRTRRAP